MKNCSTPPSVLSPPPESLDRDRLLPSGQSQTLEWLLVLSAMGIPHRLIEDEDGLWIAIAPHDASRARREIATYERENRNWPPPLAPNPAPAQRSGWSAVWVAGLLGALYFWFGPYHSGHPALSRAVCDAELVLQGEWWRVATAIGVHADIGHLGSNIIAVLAFGSAAVTAFGGGVVWCAALLAAAVANLAGVHLFSASRVSLGASTATFALLGLLAGRRLALQLGFRRPAIVHRKPFSINKSGGVPFLSRRHWQPLGAALALFAILGTAPHTDVSGHLLGMLGGMALGAVAHALAAEKLPEAVQRALELAAVAGFMWAWRTALLHV